MSTLVMVYGSLKKGYRLCRYLESSRFIGEVRTAPKYRLVDLGAYPGLLHADRDGDSVAGELYEVDDRTLAVLDEVEGVPHLYDRERIEVVGVSAPVYGYVFQGRL